MVLCTDCPTDAFLPRVQYGTREVFTKVGTELLSLVNTDLKDTYLDVGGDVCGTSLSAEAIRNIPLNYSRQVALFHTLSHFGVCQYLACGLGPRNECCCCEQPISEQQKFFAVKQLDAHNNNIHFVAPIHTLDHEVDIER